MQPVRLLHNLKQQRRALRVCEPQPSVPSAAHNFVDLCDHVIGELRKHRQCRHVVFDLQTGLKRRPENAGPNQLQAQWAAAARGSSWARAALGSSASCHEKHLAELQRT